MTSLLISGTDEAKNECESKITAIYESLFSLTMEVILFFPDKAVETNEAVIEFVKHVDTFFDAYCDVIESALLCGNLRKNRKAKKNKYAVGILYPIDMRTKTPAIESSR